METAAAGGDAGRSGATTRAMRVPAPEPWSQVSRWSGLPTVADNPMRWIGRPVTLASRSRMASRCQPRSSAAKAWTSSTTTARTLPKRWP